MIDDDTQRGDRFREARNFWQSVRTSQDIKRETELGELTKIAQHRRIGERGFLPHTNADAAKQWIAGEAFQLRRELRATGLYVAHDATNARMILREVEHPLIVVEPRAGFDHHGASDAMRLRELQEFLRINGTVKHSIAFGWPRHALRTRGIIKVRVRVEDSRRALRPGHTAAPRSDGRHRHRSCELTAGDRPGAHHAVGSDVKWTFMREV